MDKFNGTFTEWLRSGHTARVDPMDGGTLIPPAIKLHRDGFRAFLFRMVGDERGYEVVDMQKYLREHLNRKATKHGG